MELERITARTAANADRIAELTQRLATGADDLAQAREQLATLAGEREQHRSFLESATAESSGSREAAQQQQAAGAGGGAGGRFGGAAGGAESARDDAADAADVGRLGTKRLRLRLRWRGWSRRRSGWLSESEIARQELETLGLQRGQVKLSFESVTERLKRLEAEIAELRLQIEARRSEEAQSKRRGDQLRGEVATSEWAA